MAESRHRRWVASPYIARRPLDRRPERSLARLFQNRPCGHAPTAGRHGAFELLGVDPAKMFQQLEGGKPKKALPPAQIAFLVREVQFGRLGFTASGHGPAHQSDGLKSAKLGLGGSGVSRRVQESKLEN